MTDITTLSERELIELAAEAAEIDSVLGGFNGFYVYVDGCRWNPVEFKQDADRLMLSLKISLIWIGDQLEANHEDTGISVFVDAAQQHRKCASLSPVAPL